MYYVLCRQQPCPSLFFPEISLSFFLFFFFSDFLLFLRLLTPDSLLLALLCLQCVCLYAFGAFYMGSSPGEPSENLLRSTAAEHPALLLPLW